MKYSRSNKSFLMRWSAALSLCVWLGVVIGFSTLDVAYAQTPKPAKQMKTGYQYAAKVVCSLLLPQQDGSLARGTYRTLVNIHNPTNQDISIAAKVALASGFGTDPGPFGVTPFKEAKLSPDGATSLSCFDVAGFFCPINNICVDFAFLEGFVVIKSPVPLDVVSVYTARHTDGEVETIDVETVAPRLIKETVAVGYGTAPPAEMKHMDYPPKDSPAYGKSPPKQMCGGIASIACQGGKVCVDDPSDTCDPTKGGADCPGICVTPASK